MSLARETAEFLIGFGTGAACVFARAGNVSESIKGYIAYFIFIALFSAGFRLASRECSRETTLIEAGFATAIAVAVANVSLKLFP